MLSIHSSSLGFNMGAAPMSAPRSASRAAASMGSPDEFTLAVLGDLHVSDPSPDPSGQPLCTSAHYPRILSFHAAARPARS